MRNKESTGPYVYAADNIGIAGPDGLTYTLQRGQVWAADDPLPRFHAGRGIFVTDICELAPEFPRRSVHLDSQHGVI